jgi:hypothetical protein
MSRWHKEACAEPKVVPKGGVPQCRACGSFPELDALIAAQKDSGGLPAMPPDEPLSRLNLKWPPDVPYSRNGVPIRPVRAAILSAASRTEQTNECRSGESAEAEERAAGSHDDRPRSSARPETAKASIVYTNLRPDQFRLICLDAVEDDSHPVHMSLQIYSNERCPEYETVSYTWAGEDGDCSKCRPIYVGPYWDVLFQTKNCWSMVSYLRPSRGNRYIWVDAICIDQDNMREREEQVAKMGQIYKESLRVIVWLGDDIVRRPLHPHPRRLQLHELEFGWPVTNSSNCSERTPTFMCLLKRRYFSRLWVVQELLLAREVVIPLGEELYLAGPVTGAMMSAAGARKGWSWKESSSPWLERMGRGGAERLSVPEMLVLTSNSRASDPRDMLFGILGLVAMDPDCALVPNYSLSCQHLFIGLFAYHLICCRQASLLLHAAGLLQGSSGPSWLPCLSELRVDRWHILFNNASGREEDLTIIKSALEQTFSQENRHGFYRSAEITTSQNKSLASIHWPWYRDACIDAESGCLSINLVCLRAIPTQPIYLASCRSLGVYQIALEQESWPGYQPLLFLTSRFALDKIVTPGLDKVFALERGDEGPLLFFILRQMAPGSRFKLFADCQQVFLCGYQISEASRERSPKQAFGREESRSTPAADDWMQALLERIQPTLHRVILELKAKDTPAADDARTEPGYLNKFPRFRSVPLASVQYSLRDAILRIHSEIFLVPSLWTRLHWVMAFPGLIDWEGFHARFLKLCLTLTGGRGRAVDRFTQAYAQIYDGKVPVEISDGFVKLKLDAKRSINWWAACNATTNDIHFPAWRSSGLSFQPGHWVRDADGWLFPYYWKNPLTPRWLRDHVKLRLKFDLLRGFLEAYVKESLCLEGLCGLGLSEDEIEHRILNGPRPGDAFIGAPVPHFKDPRGLLGMWVVSGPDTVHKQNWGLDGGTHRVHVL